MKTKIQIMVAAGRLALAEYRLEKSRHALTGQYDLELLRQYMLCAFRVFELTDGVVIPPHFERYSHAYKNQTQGNRKLRRVK